MIIQRVLILKVNDLAYLADFIFMKNEKNRDLFQWGIKHLAR